MTSTIASIAAPSVDAPEASRALTKAEQREELDRMGKVMVQEGGLLNVAQAALFLEVSRERVYELLGLCILKRFDFLGRTYLSFDEIKARRAADVKAGRPPRSLAQAIKGTLKAALEVDAGQIRRGGTTDYAAKKLGEKMAKTAKKAEKAKK